MTSGIEGLLRPNREGRITQGRYLLMDEKDFTDLLRFHFNPSEWQDDMAAEYGEGGGQGNPRPIPAYNGGAARLFKMNLLFNDFGDRTGVVHGKTTEEAIAFLQRKMEPEVESPSGVGKVPATMLFVPGQIGVFRVVVRSANVKRIAFDPYTKKALRAFVDLVLEEVWDTPEDGEQARASRDLSESR